MRERELDNYERLASAICAACMEDYYKALLILKRHPGNRDALDEVKADEDFLRSPEFDLFTTLDMTGEEVIEKLRTQAQKGGRWE